MAAYAKSYPSPTTVSFFFIFSVSSLLSLASSSDSPTVYEILPKFGLPSGLLPSSVQSYTLDDDGAFAVQLVKPCYIQFDYLVYYDKSISGKLRYGSITELKGIQVQRFFLWLDVDQIKVDLPPSDSIYFQVGFINKKLDIDQVDLPGRFLFQFLQRFVQATISSAGGNPTFTHRIKHLPRKKVVDLALFLGPRNHTKVNLDSQHCLNSQSIVQYNSHGFWD